MMMETITIMKTTTMISKMSEEIEDLCGLVLMVESHSGKLPF